MDAVQIPQPEALTAELTKMRRNPHNFTILDRFQCKFCGTAKTAYGLLNAKCESCGSWCPVHGWLYFDTVDNPPTERLTGSELEDRRLSAQRKRPKKAN